MACAVAQDGQAAGTEARKGGTRPARMGGPFMALVYRFFRTFCYHVLWPPRRVLVDLELMGWINPPNGLTVNHFSHRHYG